MTRARWPARRRRLLALAYLLASTGMVILAHDFGRRLDLERAARESAERVQAEERRRALLLWRLEAEVQPLVLRESLRDPTHFRALVPSVLGRRPEISPLLGAEVDQVLLHFTWETSGAVGSPQVPTPEEAARGAAGVVQPEVVTAGRKRLEHLRERLARADRAAVARSLPLALERPREARSDWALRNSAWVHAAQQRLNGKQNFLPGNPLERAWRRSSAVGPFIGAWIEGELLLLRRAFEGADEEIQGVWLDACGLQEALTRRARALGHRVVIEALGEQSEEQARLAALPFLVRATPRPLTARAPQTARLLAPAAAAVAALLVALLLLASSRHARRQEEFLALIAHETRTPLQAAKLSARLLSSGRLSDHPERHEHHLGALETEIERLGHLLEGVFEEQRRRGAGVPSGPQGKRALGPFLEDVGSFLASRARLHGLDLRWRPPSVLPPLAVRIDAPLLERILGNALQNVARHAAISDARVWARARIRKRWLILTIRDRGPGPMRAPRDGGQGLGLGLEIVRRCAALLGARVRLDPARSGGARFTLRLPLTPSERDAAPAAHSPPPRPLRA